MVMEITKYKMQNTKHANLCKQTAAAAVLVLSFCYGQNNEVSIISQLFTQCFQINLGCEMAL